MFEFGLRKTRQLGDDYKMPIFMIDRFEIVEKKMMNEVVYSNLLRQGF